MTTFDTLIDNNRTTKLIVPFKNRISPPVHFSFANWTSVIHSITRMVD
ncbi:hypothetical protein V7O66_11900 [Methanolobus sp. ZRKC3]